MGDAHLKVILETASWHVRPGPAREDPGDGRGTDFIKTSTGKVQPAATLPVTLVMLEAIRDFEKATGPGRWA